jgi:tetratricopeptide (TPR) repeat protein
MTASHLYDQMQRAARAKDHETVIALGDLCLAELASDFSMLHQRANAHSMMANSLQEVERLPDAVRHFEAALYGPSTEHLTIYQRPSLTMSLANTYWKVGRYQDLSAAVAPIINGMGSPSQASTALRILSSVAWRTTGNLEEATTLLSQSAIAAGETGSLWWRDAVYRGQYLMELGRLGEAQAVLRHGVEQENAEMIRLGKDDRVTLANLSIFLGALARVEVRLGNVDVAERLHQESGRLLPPARQFGAYTWNLCACEIAAARREWDAATDHADTCILLTTHMGAIPSMAVSWKLRGTVDLGQDRVRPAIEWFTKARDTYRDLGHVRDHYEMDQQLRALGAT